MRNPWGFGDKASSFVNDSGLDGGVTARDIVCGYRQRTGERVSALGQVEQH